MRAYHWAFIRRAIVIPAVFALALAVWATATDSAHWSPAPESAAATAAPATAAPLMMAETYAARHGLTDCVTPADADLDAVFLTIPVDDVGTATGERIYRTDLDTALDSAGKRLVLLGCRDATP